MKDRIRSVMEYAKMTQQDFAARLGISPASLSSIFTGRTNPTNNHVMAVHRVFPEININWLMFGEGEMLAAPASENGGAVENMRNQAVGSPSIEAAADGGGISVMPSASMLNKESPIPYPSAHPLHHSYGEYHSSPSAPNTGIIFDKSGRRIKEIRVFYSDGTYESFVPSSK